MTRGAIFWEQGKYVVILTMVLAIGRTRQASNPLPVAQFALLIPSSLITLVLLPFSLARDALSFNLSGPLCLCVTAVFLSTVVLGERDLCKLLVLALGPIFGIAVLTVYNLATVPIEVEFTNRSNYFVTGGFGPNQVSAALGLGIVLGVLLVLAGRLPAFSRLLLAGCVLFFVSQSALTLSRNGLYCGIGSGLLATPFLLTDPKVRRRFVVAVPILSALFVFAVLPALDSVTDGGVSRRLDETSSTGRDEILAGELELWRQNPVFGVGPGVARYVRGDVWEAAAHTEFSRLLAEHGLFGLAALLLYPVMALATFLSAKTGLSRATVVAGVSWSLSFMLVNAMRMAAPSLLFGMAFLRIEPERTPRPCRRPARVQHGSMPPLARPSYSTPGLQ
jgi:O-antigen ligase